MIHHHAPQKVNMNKLIGTYVIRTLIIVWLLTITLPNAVAAGESSWPKTPADFAVLPKYCLYKSHKNQYPRQYAKWERLLGHAGWIHIHHYCYGMFALHNAKSTIDPKEKENWIYIALKQWNYVDKNWPRDFRLRPELHVKRGDTFMEAGNMAAALAEYRKAIAAKPDYSLPYVRLADYYIDQGKKEEALEWVRKGLRNAPKSKKLRRRLKTLENGKG